MVTALVAGLGGGETKWKEELQRKPRLECPSRKLYVRYLNHCHGCRYTNSFPNPRNLGGHPKPAWQWSRRGGTAWELHKKPSCHWWASSWSDYHDKDESDNDYIIMKKDYHDNFRRPGVDDNNFFHFRAAATHKHSSGSKPKGENETVAWAWHWKGLLMMIIMVKMIMMMILFWFV